MPVAKAMAELDSKVAPYLKNLKLDADVPDARGIAYLTSIGKLRLLNDSEKVRKLRLEVDLKVEANQKVAVAEAGRQPGPQAASSQSAVTSEAEERARAARMAKIRNSASSSQQSISFGYEVVRPTSAR
ncbi:hypothetical protein ACQ859_20365 [Roseateles chitinivorans]|uniref:hypothetical protein n=1 Tax=Roseateles chitinivorans TaxID=2917965 RepID=UPI003D671D7E